MSRDGRFWFVVGSSKILQAVAHLAKHISISYRSQSCLKRMPKDKVILSEFVSSISRMTAMKSCYPLNKASCILRKLSVTFKWMNKHDYLFLLPDSTCFTKLISNSWLHSGINKWSSQIKPQNTIRIQYMYTFMRASLFAESSYHRPLHSSSSIIWEKLNPKQQSCLELSNITDHDSMTVKCEFLL